MVKKIFSLWVPVLLWAGLIFYLSHQPNLKITEGVLDIVLRKIAHIGEYAIFTFLVWRIFKEKKRQYLNSGLVSFFYSVSDEFHQSFIPTRNGSLVDILIDSLGIIIMLFLIKKYYKFFQRI